ncbi:MAG: type II toxin-antitoxin system PemK/MazF family toxin [Cyclobacteriaceae bacterium]|jgi:mRNA interferase MazF|uniref:Type II toxin-antitoxin system PemK/MazF family toxin n=1 Tax=Algoriphagus marincola TaxID=264027 RepID=A0ABS7NA03_9BACT|nr:type II toxin-antitoxin system PemK/MazF family toxin [Algoriphagus marincola]MBY5952806.1 type II toxin-antitoxin system PemK/MazF family toxin [Algoriphagus marincola]MCR9081215.1 type II toxin-antitoxin system PemK/MazF family toxin [Cyclobacteriaceae bacterium]
MVKGDIVLVPFPFTDLSGTKKRPALVLFARNLDVTVSFISTQLQWKEDSDLLLNPNPFNGLKKASLLRTSKIATLDKSLVIGRLGSLSISEVKMLNKKLLSLFELE